MTVGTTFATSDVTVTARCDAHPGAGADRSV